ncbi:uncharacterized protein LOC128957873 [Oppia nitens]|uniref:uncharacterized protein LOC128957873 n=1 Tax=Oppia nitens TaxID=1686743 RepID=UPI0023DB8A1D|nr:uncharacterized protein LOC128957873 [Oppia nitens]
MDPLGDDMKQLVNTYMTTNNKFIQDLQILTNTLHNNDNQLVFAFSHQLDINYLLKSSQQSLDLFGQYLSENFDEFWHLFYKRLKRRIGSQVLGRRKIWLCLKLKNLPQRFHVKKYEDLMTFPFQVLSLESLQIVSISEPLKTVIATKVVATDERNCDEPIKWIVRQFNETNEKFENHSERYVESIGDRIYAIKRQFKARVGTNGDSCLNPIEITANYYAFTLPEIHCLYNGSHLQIPVLLKSKSSSGYFLLSFDKFCFPTEHKFGLNNEFKQFLTQFPQQIQLLYEDRQQSNYSFALTLAFIFADNISLIGSFFRLKLGLLLNLLSLNDYSKRNLSSVLVICNDTLIIRRLLEWSSLFCRHQFIQSLTSMSMTGMSRTGTSIEWTDSGTLQLGADGVTVISSCIGLNELPDKAKISLLQALETNVMVARNSQPSVGLEELDLKSTVWATIENNIEEREVQQTPRTLYKTQKILWTEVFAMVYVIESLDTEYSYQPNNEFIIDRFQWQQTLNLMASIKTQMGKTANDYLQRYFVANRQIRGPVMKKISMEALICLSKASAKLSFRQTVTKFDALIAILLYEESLSARFPNNRSQLGVEPIFHVQSEDMELAIGPNCDTFMTAFEERFLQFTAKFAPKEEPSQRDPFGDSVVKDELNFVNEE